MNYYKVEYFLTKEKLFISALPFDTWHIDKCKNAPFKRIETDFVSWKSKYLNRRKGSRSIKETNDYKIIVVYNSSMFKEVVNGSFVEIDLLPVWLDNKIKAIEQFFLVDQKEEMKEVPTIKTILGLKEKITNHKEITRSDVDLVIRSVSYIKGRSIIGNQFQPKDIEIENPDLVEYFDSLDLLKSYYDEEMIMYANKKVALVERSVPDVVIDILEKRGLNVVIIKNTQILVEINRLIYQGKVKLKGNVAEVHDSVDVSIVDYLKNEEHYKIKVI